MLAKSQRLTKKEVDVVLAQGKITHSPLFLVRSANIPGQTAAKMSAVAPQKIFKTASARNNMRRKIYNASRAIISNLVSTASVAVFAKAPAANSDADTLATGLKEVFVKAGLIR